MPFKKALQRLFSCLKHYPKGSVVFYIRVISPFSRFTPFTQGVCESYIFKNHLMNSYHII